MLEPVAGSPAAVPAGIPAPRTHGDGSYRYAEVESDHRAEDRVAGFGGAHQGDPGSGTEWADGNERADGGERVPATERSGAVERAGAVERPGAASGRIAAQMVDRLRHNAELSADRGTTTIADEVVEKIVAVAARQIPGVYDLGGEVDHGVSVKLSGNTATIRIVLVVEYGSVVRSVTGAVRSNVISAVETMLDLDVTAVDIVIDDVYVVDPHGDDSLLP